MCIILVDVVVMVIDIYIQLKSAFPKNISDVSRDDYITGFRRSMFVTVVLSRLIIS